MSMINKKQFYSDKTVVKGYIEHRYGGKSGKLVLKHENNSIEGLLDDLENGRTIIDMPVGTGRLKSIVGNKHTLIGVDSSKAMLNQIEDLGYDRVIQGDVVHTNLDDEISDVIVQLRFYSHYKDIRKFILESRRLLKPKGYLIFDTVNWSPRQVPLKIWKKQGGLIFIHSRKKIMKLMNELDFKFIKRKDSFLFSLYAHKKLPYLIVKFLIYIEKFIPDKLKVATFWKFEKVSN